MNFGEGNYKVIVVPVSSDPTKYTPVSSDPADVTIPAAASSSDQGAGGSGAAATGTDAGASVSRWKQHSNFWR